MKGGDKSLDIIPVSGIIGGGERTRIRCRVRDLQSKSK
jgi:hypothetical protein